MSLPQYLLPGLCVVIGVAPAHLHRSHQGVLPEHVGAEASVHVLTLLQGEAGQAEHEGQDSPCGVAAGRQREREGESMQWCERRLTLKLYTCILFFLDG